MSGAGAHWGGVPLGGHRFFSSVLAPWVVVPGMLLGVSSCLFAVACALPGIFPAWRVGVVSAGALGVGCAGVAGVVLPAVVCRVSCFATACY